MREVDDFTTTLSAQTVAIQHNLAASRRRRRPPVTSRVKGSGLRACSVIVGESR